MNTVKHNPPTVLTALILAFAFPCVLPETTCAELIAYEDFDYEDGNLRGEDGGEGDWSGAWAAGSGFGSGQSWQIGPPSLSYTDSGGRRLLTRGGAARANAGEDSIEFRETRSWSSAGWKDDGDVLWFSFLFNRSSNNTHGVHFFIVGDGGLDNGLGLFLGNFSTGARINNSTGGYEKFSPDEDHLVVGRITFADDNEDEVRYWLDPELSEIPSDAAPNSGVLTGSANPTSWDNLYMRHPQSPGTDMIDEIRIGTDFFSVAPYAQCAPMPSNVVSWWRGETNALDSVSTNHGALVNGAGFTNGIVGQAFHLDGVDDYVDVGDLDALRDADAVTVMAWVKKTHTNDSRGGILGQWNTSGGGQADNRYLLYNGEGPNMHHGSFALQLADGSLASVAGTSNFPLNEWVHVAGVWRSSDGRIAFYKNGMLENVRTQGVGRVVSSVDTATAKIGEWGVVRDQNYKWPGDIDETVVLDRALSAGEISAIYAAGSAGFCVVETRPRLLTPQFNGTNVLVSFLGVPGATYRCEYTDDLGDANWTPLAGDLVGTADPVVVTHFGVADRKQRFYRVIRTNPPQP